VHEYCEREAGRRGEVRAFWMGEAGREKEKEEKQRVMKQC